MNLFLVLLAQTGLAEVCWHLKDDASESGRLSLVDCLLTSPLQLLNLLAVDCCCLHDVYQDYVLVSSSSYSSCLFECWVARCQLWALWDSMMVTKLREIPWKLVFFTAFQPEASPRHSLRVFVGRGYGLCSIELSKGVGNLSKDTSCGEAFVAQCWWLHQGCPCSCQASEWTSVVFWRNGTMHPM